jgi:hypothetical protein
VAALAVSCGGTEGAVVTTQQAERRPMSWQIQLTGEIDTSYAVDRYEVDLDTSAEVIDELHAAGRSVACYFSAGTLESFRSDAGEFPSEAVGEPMAAYPDESWLDLRDATVRSIMVARLEAALQQGCDEVDPSNLDGFLAATGFPLTLDDALDTARLLASEARDRGLSPGLSGGDVSFIESLTAEYDWALAMGCVRSTGCSQFSRFTTLGKPVFVVEFGDEDQVAEICPRAEQLGLNAILKNSELDAFRVGCP